MEIVIKILQFIASFSLLVIIHELGHFLWARAFGIRVEKFYLFFDPWFSLFKFTYKGTEYGIGWIPFGGYVKIAGMVDESMDTDQLKQPAKPDEFRSKPAWKRLCVMLGGVVMNVLLALMIYIGMCKAWGEEYFAPEDIKYGYVFSGLGHEMGFKDGDRLVSVDGKSYDDITPMLQALLFDPARWVTVQRGDSMVDVEIGEEFLAAKLQDPNLLTIRVPFVVYEPVAGSEALKAGVMAGDKLVMIDSLDARFQDQSTKLLAERSGKTAMLTFMRDSAGQQIAVTLPIAVDAAGKIGAKLTPATELLSYKTHEYSFLQAIPAGIKRTGSEIAGYWKQIKMIANPKTEAYKSLGGVISIGSIFPSSWSWFGFWNVTAFLSIILAVMNVLPIPGLDGGHALFAIVEMITGKKPSDKFMEFAQILGMCIILLLILYATGNDIYRFFIK